LPKGLPINIT